MKPRRPPPITLLIVVVIVLLLMGAAPGRALADDERQSLGDAWWTGPLVANSAGALPQGHVLIEPYLYDVRSSQVNTFGSLTYMEYAVTNRLMAGVVPTFGYSRASNGQNSAGIAQGDFSVLAQYSLTRFHEGSWVPDMALMVQETLPTGQYDRLSRPLVDAQGSGAYTTTVQLNTQMYFWLPNGRILRMRFNVGQSFSRAVPVNGVSVYGTPAGFHGHGVAGNAFLANAAWEYSMTLRWVLAFDLLYHYSRGAQVDGAITTDAGHAPLNFRTGSSASFGFAPAIEYNWRSNLGLIMGVRVFTGGHNSTHTVTPAIALNYVH
ncbi:transporter [Dyella solisilvae]|uniref:Transporter n=1 Tax=Dyella solisilvae TaxID=1920168 RepID=A0A370K3F1_9GAMM|nr:transporter [Dyella solisilvae]RDI97184.1 transporter [Dyella solisilvae]